MKYFVIEGQIKNAEQMNDELLKEHMAYTQQMMDQGFILMSTLKSDMSGGLFIMKSESLELVEQYLAKEPFHVAGLQDYKVTEFMAAHYFNESALEWFKN